MIRKIISGILILVTVYLNCKHGWAGITGKLPTGQMQLMRDSGLTKPVILLLSIFSLAVCGLTVIPKTFFIGNVINATSILIVIAFALNAKNYKIVLMELPFLLIPLALIWLRHPLKNN